jgi:hypothetical protein
METTKKLNLIDIVKNNTVHFDSYKNGYFYYLVKVDAQIYRFPVEMIDIGAGTIHAVDKALTFMRWIRKSIENKQFVKI